jgi:membrane-associated protein
MSLSTLLDSILHVDKYLGVIIAQYGVVTYVLLFLIIFAETGFVLTPFLPGDSLLFAIGAFATQGALSVWWIVVVLILAAVLGDTVNYTIGRRVGVVFFEKRKLIKQEYLDKTNTFYDKHGKKTIILARFVPIVRTFAPFVAGIGKMNYRDFLMYNMIGGVLWVGFFVFGGYFFGNLEIVQQNFSAFILLIIVVSILPLVWEYVKHKKDKKK